MKDKRQGGLQKLKSRDREVQMAVAGRILSLTSVSVYHIENKCRTEVYEERLSHD